MDRPEIVDRYRELAVTINKLDKEKKALYDEVKVLINESGGWDDLYLQEKNGTDYDEESILIWVSETYPDYYDDITKTAVDWKAFAKLIKSQKIDASQMPSHCVITSKTYSVCTTPRVKKDESNEYYEVD